ETPNPGVAIPRAMRMTIYVGMTAAAFVCLALILAQPDIGAIVAGKISDPVERVLLADFGPTGARLVVAVVMVSFISCILSLQAAASRLVFAYARDEMVVRSTYFAKISPHTHVPVRALVLSGVVAAIIICLGLFLADALTAIVSSAIVAIYAAFQMIVIGALTARLRGWHPGGRFTLGRWGLTVNVVGILYGVSAILDLLWPRTPDSPWYVNYSLSVSVAVMVICGVLYMVLGRPYDRGTAPAGDAWKISTRKIVPAVPADA
ncbi:MAG TPA: amino acid permease, partial [Acetobacteraceae bacterium]|nr:amino acid permease [Acetobacteraceae bacterium]